MSVVSAPMAHGATCRWKIRAVMSALYSTSGPTPPGPGWSSAARSRRTGHGRFPATGSGPAPRFRPVPLSPGSPIEDQHTASAPTRTQIIEGLIQLVQRHPARDQLIQCWIAAQIVADQNRDVAMQIRRSEIAPLNGLLAHER